MNTLVETTLQEFKTQLVEAEAREELGDCWNISADAYRINSPQFNGSMSWNPVSSPICSHSKAELERPRVSHTLTGRPAGTCRRCSAYHPFKSEDMVQAPKGRSGDHQLAPWGHSLLKVKTQLTDESLQELPASSKLLAHHAFIGLSQNFIRKEAADAFFDKATIKPRG
jgi:hypothetical protein